jgi:hypothetical protein
MIENVLHLHGPGVCDTGAELPSTSSLSYDSRFNVVAKRCIFLGGRWKRRYQLPEKDVISRDELLSALRRYLEESGDTEQAVASKIGMNHHTLHRWLSDNESPKKGGGKLALTALFLRRAGYL